MLEFLFWLIFVFVVIGYVFKLFIRYALPWLLTRFMQNQQKKYSDTFNRANSSNQDFNSGKVNIKSKKETNKKQKDDDFGEYVDYEDVD